MTKRTPSASGDLLLAATAGLLAIAFYAWTWSGRYYHDGQFFVDQLEAGDIEHMHVAYLPLAWGLLKFLGLLGSATPESALNVLSLLSGGLTVGLGAWLAARISGSRAGAVIAAFVLLLAPSLWFSSVIPEIHGFTAAGAALGAALAWHGVGGAFLAPALATLVALSAHLTCAALFPAFVVLALAGRAQRGDDLRWRASGVATVLAGATLALVPYLTARTLGPNTDASGGLGGAMVRFLGALVSDPVGSMHELHLRFLLPWGLCALGPVLMLTRPRASLGVAGPWTLLAVALAFGGVLVPTLRMSWVHGMYVAPLAPFCAIALAIPLATYSVRLVRIAGVAIVAAQAWLGIAGPVGYRSFAPDVDLHWAQAAAAQLEAGDQVFLQDNRRRKRLLQETDATVHYLLSPPHPTHAQLAQMARSVALSTQTTGRRVFVDPWLYGPDCPEPVAAAAHAVAAAVVLEQHPDAPLLQIVGAAD